MPNGQASQTCVMGNRIDQRVTSLTERFDMDHAALQKADDDQWTAIDKLRAAMDSVRNRPPVWASMLITVLVGVVAVLATLLATGR